jgi:glycosyltransferase involved in cell wall biosynthesis
MRICVITPSFNQRSFLEHTLSSVLGQQGDFELRHLVFDACSSDGTVEFLRSVTDPRLRWQSEKDSGQADAINRAMSQADGDVVGWLNSDDLYVPGALAAVAAAFSNPAVKWIIGRYQIIDHLGRIIREPIVRYKNRSLDRYSYRALLRENFISQPAVFWRRDFGQQIGPLDSSLHYTMDYDLWLRMGRLAEPVVLKQILAQFRLHPASKSGKVNREQFDEGYRVAKRYFNGDRFSQLAHRFHVEKIVWVYRVMRMIGR